MEKSASEEAVKGAIYRMTQLGQDPKHAKISMLRWAYDPDEEEISAAVHEAARRLGVEDNS